FHGVHACCPMEPVLTTPAVDRFHVAALGERRDEGGGLQRFDGAGFEPAIQRVAGHLVRQKLRLRPRHRALEGGDSDLHSSVPRQKRASRRSAYSFSTRSRWTKK